jgi:D-alanine-D-alanine ligase
VNPVDPQGIGAAALGRVAVLMGGRSAEREISLLSGNQVLAALHRRGVDASAVDVTPDIARQLLEGEYARAFIALHGRGGEDGLIQGALETLGLPYTGSGVLASALGMDKFRTKLLWKGAGLPTPDFVLLRKGEDLVDARALGFPLMIKPAREGSSIGMARVDTPDELELAWRKAREYDPLVIAETWVEGIEYTTAILGHDALPLIRLETPNTFYDFEAKYRSDSTRYHCPCGLSDTDELRLQELALTAFNTIGATGWGRIDLFLDRGDRPWLIELNTVPGMTDHSLVPMAAQSAGIDFDELVWRILATSAMEKTNGV